MKLSTRARGYDLLKLIVAIVLLLLFLLLLWRGNPLSPTPTATLLPFTKIPSYTRTVMVTLTPTQSTATAVPVFSPAATQTLLPTLSPTVAIIASPTSTAFPQIESTSTL